MAQKLDQILKELDAGYSPGRKLINQRLAQLPAQANAEVAGLQAQEQDYYDNTIMAGARQRGVGFGGIPIGERARYGATQYLPAVARVKQSQNDLKSSLLGSLADIGNDQRKTALGIREGQLTRDEARRQFDLSQQAARRAAAQQASLYGALSGGDTQPTKPSMAAVDFAELAKNELLRAGNIKPFAREAVRDNLMLQYGLSRPAADKIIYKQVFPDDWERPNRPALRQLSSPGLRVLQNSGGLVF